MSFVFGVVESLKKVAFRLRQVLVSVVIPVIEKVRTTTVASAKRVVSAGLFKAQAVPVICLSSAFSCVQACFSGSPVGGGPLILPLDGRGVAVFSSAAIASLTFHPSRRNTNRNRGKVQGPVVLSTEDFPLIRT